MEMNTTELDGGAAELQRKLYQKRSEEASKALTDIHQKFPRILLAKQETVDHRASSVREITLYKNGKMIKTLTGLICDGICYVWFYHVVIFMLTSVSLRRNQALF